RVWRYSISGSSSRGTRNPPTCRSRTAASEPFLIWPSAWASRWTMNRGPIFWSSPSEATAESTHAADPVGSTGGMSMRRYASKSRPRPASSRVSTRAPPPSGSGESTRPPSSTSAHPSAMRTARTIENIFWRPDGGIVIIGWPSGGRSEQSLECIASLTISSVPRRLSIEWRRFRRATARLDRQTVFVLVAAALLVILQDSLGSRRLFRTELAGYFPTQARGILAWAWWFGMQGITGFILPAAALLFLFRRRPSEVGLGLGDWRFALRIAALYLPI